MGVLCLLLLAWAYFTSRGYMFYDSDLYHGQSIRWIEEYGVVKGLGNLHERFAYNSSAFALSALYSMKFLVHRSLHTLSGYWAFLLSVSALDIARSFKRHRLLVVAAVFASYLFWQFSAPLVRYGYAYVLLLAALPVGMLLTRWGRDRLLFWLLVCYGVYKAGRVGEYALSQRAADNYIWQQGYGSYELGTYEIDGITFYYGVNGDRTGYDLFPTSPQPAEITLRGAGLKDGFRRK